MRHRYMRISELGRVVTGKTPPTNRSNVFDGEYMFVTPSDLEYNHYFCHSTERTVTDEAKSLLRNQFIPANSIMFTCIGATIGKCGISSTECLTNQQINSIVPNDKTDPQFLYYLLCLNAETVKGLGGGAATPIVNKSKFEEIELLVPSFEDQKAIARTLSSYDDLIDNNRRRMALLEDSARQLYREWFVRLRFPGHEHTPIVDGVPQGWERRTAFDSMQVLSGGTPKTSISDYWDGETPFFTPKDAVDGIWVSSCERSLTELGIKNCNSKLYPRETVFITARGTVGKLNMAQTPMAMSQSCYALVAKDHLSQRFIYSAMKEGVEALRQQAVGAVFDAIVVDTFKRIHLIVPTATVLRMFDEAVEPVFAQVENLASQNQKLRQARDLLLPRLMNGELAV